MKLNFKNIQFIKSRWIIIAKIKGLRPQIIKIIQIDIPNQTGLNFETIGTIVITTKKLINNSNVSQKLNELFSFSILINFSLKKFV